MFFTLLDKMDVISLLLSPVSANPMIEPSCKYTAFGAQLVTPMAHRFCSVVLTDTGPSVRRFVSFEKMLHCWIHFW